MSYKENVEKLIRAEENKKARKKMSKQTRNGTAKKPPRPCPSG